MIKVALAFLLMLVPAPEDEPIKIGIVGLDTSHVVAFTAMLNDPKSASHVPGARVVCAYKGGSPDIESSASRIEGFTKTLQEKWGVEIVDSIETLCTKVDAVLLESVDGRPHLEQALPCFKAGKKVFILRNPDDVSRFLTRIPSMLRLAAVDGTDTPVRSR